MDMHFIMGVRRGFSLGVASEFLGVDGTMCWYCFGMELRSYSIGMGRGIVGVGVYWPRTEVL